ncbi:Zinc carboxypeptidase A 1 [Gryllus bimaculatus]|nr:Zinc carboxypeptidase A 1 [Gryllus bimaculatus]
MTGGLRLRRWRVLRAQPEGAEQLRHLESLVRALGAEGASQLWRWRPATDVLVRGDVADAVMRFLGARGIAANVHVADVGAEIRRERSADAQRRGPRPHDVLRSYLRYDEMNEFMDDLQRRFPHLATVATFGRSYEGRDMKVMQISSGGGGQRPVILIDAGIHAREWIAPAMALYIIQQLVENPSNADLIANVDWHVIPLLNPDGYEYSHTTDRMWRKTRSVTDVPECFGADPNRNFDFYWGVVGVSWDPCKETYAGHEPFSEAESEALAMYGLSLRGRLRLYVAIHSYGGVALGQEVAGAIRRAGIPRFDVGNCFEMLGECTHPRFPAYVQMDERRVLSQGVRVLCLVLEQAARQTTTWR